MRGPMVAHARQVPTRAPLRRTGKAAGESEAGGGGRGPPRERRPSGESLGVPWGSPVGRGAIFLTVCQGNPPAGRYG